MNIRSDRKKIDRNNSGQAGKKRNIKTLPKQLLLGAPAVR